MPGFETCADVREFFRDQVAEAMKSLAVRTAEPTAHYLVNLLAGYAGGDKVHEVSSPFVEQLGKALAASGIDRLKRFRELGDAALFVGGFLSDSCDRRGVTQPYVVAIGARAYGEVGREVRRNRRAGHGHSEVYEELADRFEAFLRVLDEVREQTALRSDGDVIVLYERWCRTRSPRVFRRLHRRGVVPDTQLAAAHERAGNDSN